MDSTSVLQRAKKHVQALHQSLTTASSSTLDLALARHCDTTLLWRGVYPFDAADDLHAAGSFWRSLQSAFSHLSRREYLFFAGHNEMDGGASVWVVSAGYMQGLFDSSWLGIRPHSKLALLRYCSFYRVEEHGRISEWVMHVDIPNLMQQVGQSPFPTQTAAALNPPGPATQDGLLFEATDAAEGRQTLSRINSMIDHLGQWQSGMPLEQELALDWHPDMLWWGPAGIGSCYTLERYAAQHARPFRAGLTERTGTGHLARLAEGHYGGFFGWPNFKARSVGGFMGLPAHHHPLEFRVVDLYRRQGAKLAENWVYIDLLHVFKQVGIEPLDTGPHGCGKNQWLSPQHGATGCGLC